MASVATTMAVAGLAGGGLSAFSQYKAGDDAKKAYDYNAQIAENEAELIRQGAALDEFRSRKQLKAFTGTQMAGYAKAGVELTGSPLDVMQDSIANAELEIAINKFNSEQAAKGKMSEADINRRTGRQVKSASQIQALSTFLGSAGDYGAKMYNPLKKKATTKSTSQVYKGGAVKSGDFSPFSWD